MTWTLVVPEALHAQLHEHLFPGDGDEHGAVLAAGVARGAQDRLLVRHVFPARDGTEYLPGQRGYRMLTAAFVRERARFCRDNGLAYLAVHCHGGTTSVGFSSDDLASHERGYPALSQLTRGQIVGGLVFASEAIAGDLWFADGTRAVLERAVIVGSQRRELFARPLAQSRHASATYDRQVRLFGDRGQVLLGQLRVGVIGAGGAGSLLNEYLARLGVGELIVVDPDRFAPSNRPRLVGSTSGDHARTWPWPRRARPKVFIAERVARDANPNVRFHGLMRNVIDETVAKALSTCDYLFLAADSAQARLVFNALVNQYLIPGVQVGTKVPVDADGSVGDVFSVVRFVEPGHGCLLCNGLISPAALQEENLTPNERRAQRYIDAPDVPAPSVISLNAVTSAHAVDDFLFNVLGLRPRLMRPWLRFRPRRVEIKLLQPSKDPACTECSVTPGSRFARGDGIPLPTRHEAVSASWLVRLRAAWMVLYARLREGLKRPRETKHRPPHR